jgi:hypothetical protein
MKFYIGTESKWAVRLVNAMYEGTPDDTIVLCNKDLLGIAERTAKRIGFEGTIEVE